MSNNKFTIYLQQHTPIIHFQHDQAGATLRATEVKPKLDKFIMNELNTYDNDLYKKYSEVIDGLFTRGYGDYKLHITSFVDKRYVLSATGGNRLRDKFSNVGTVKLVEYSSYFADSKGIDEGTKRPQGGMSEFESGNFKRVRLGIKYANIVLHFFSFHKEFEPFIKEVIPLFLASYNFGTRQTKGFGCFSTEETSLTQFRQLLERDPKNIAIYETIQNGGEEQIVKRIQKDYKYLKAGQNLKTQRSHIYEKSLLWQFICNGGNVIPVRNWEKRRIKDFLANSDDPNLKKIWNQLYYQFDTNFSSDHRSRHNLESFYVRALLGLAEHFEFKTRNDRDKVKIKVKDSDTSDDNVERFPSPIFFKVFGNRIFLIGRSINQHLFLKKNGNAREFSFKLEAEISGNKINETLFTLEIPQDFNLSEFLKFALEEFEDSPIQNYTQLK